MKLMNEIKQIKDIFTKSGYEIFLVGGCVRDSLMNLEIKDYDFATNATPAEMRKIVEEHQINNIQIIPTGEQYGTMTFRINNQSFEITTYRRDINYSDGRRPNDIAYSDKLIDDLARRDFTCNAIAYDLDKNDYIDPFNGLADIRNKTLKCVGDASIRFKEDGLRIIRAIRFSMVKGLKISDKLELGFKSIFDIGRCTYFSLINSFKLLDNISKERITSELINILENTKNYKKYLNYKIPFNSLLDYLGFNSSKIDLTKLFRVRGLEAKLAYILYYSASKRTSINIIEALKKQFTFNNKILNRVERIYKLINKQLNTKIQIKKLLSNNNSDIIYDLLFLKKAIGFKFNYNKSIQLLQTIIDKKEPFHISHLKINGDDLKNKYKPIKIKDILNYCVKEVILHPSSNCSKEFLLHLVENQFNNTIMVFYNV